jgi:serine/threonine-protein kinase
MVRGEKIDLRSDIYELGIVLYQMLVGDVPFRDDNPYTVLLKRLQEPVPLSL